MSQRICQQVRSVSLNLVTFCKAMRWNYFSRHNTTYLRQFQSSAVSRLVLQRGHFLRTFASSVFRPMMVSLGCGKQCKKPTLGMCIPTKRRPRQSFNIQVFTPVQLLSTQFAQLVSEELWSQRFSLQRDLEANDRNHQNPHSLLSSETVIKYSSHTERGRTTTPRFKRTAP